MKKTNLRQLKRNLHGVSVVIGALMLTLIVVTAAASFAIFTAQKQEELQEQEFAQLLREQEELSVNKIVDLSYNSDGDLSTISFSIANQHTRSSKIVALKINDNVISDVNVTDQINQQMQGWTLKGKYYRTAYFANDTDGNLYIFDDLNSNQKVDGDEINDVTILDKNPDGGDEANPEAGNQGYLYAKDSVGEPYLFNDTDFDGYFNPSYDWYNLSNDFFLDPDGDDLIASPSDGDRGGIYPEFDRFVIDSLGQYIISIDNAADDMIYFGETLKQNDALTIEVQTHLTNTFEKSFIPPTANIKVKGEDDSFVLDGTDSFSHNYSNIVEWEWELTNTLTEESFPPKFGRKVNANRILVDYDGVTHKKHSLVNWTINLTVTDDFGMKGIATFNHTQDFKPMMAEAESTSLGIVDFQPAYLESEQNIKNVSSVNFSIRNTYDFDSNITKLTINNVDYTANIPSWWPIINQSTSTLQTILLNPKIPMEKPISIKFKTALGNTFEKTFYPPEAIINIEYQSYQDGTGATLNREVLDGSQSDHPGDGYIVEWKWHIHTEPHLFKDLDKDGMYTAQADKLVVNVSNCKIEPIDSEFNTSAIGKELNDFNEADNVFADDRANPQIVWIENGTNDWYNRTIDEDILLLDLTGEDIYNITTNISYTNVYQWCEWKYHDENGSDKYDGNETHCEGILIDYHNGGTYSNQSDVLFNSDPDQNNEEINPTDADYGGLYIYDEYGEPYLFQNDGDYKYNGEEILSLDADGDGKIANPMEGDNILGYSDCVIQDNDNDNNYTAQADKLVVNETYPIFEEDDRSFNDSAAGEKLTRFGRNDKVFADDRVNPTVVWVENGSNDWYNKTLDEDILLLNITDGSVDNITDDSNTSGTNVCEWDDWFYFDKNGSSNFSYSISHCEDILIDYHGGNYSNQSDSIISGSKELVDGTPLQKYENSDLSKVKSYNNEGSKWDSTEDLIWVDDNDDGFYNESEIIIAGVKKLGNKGNLSSGFNETWDMILYDAVKDGKQWNFGCLFSQEAISLNGRKVNAEFDYEDNREHYITLTVIDNYGMESVTTMVYRH